MTTFRVFGVPVTIGFDNDLVEKFERYTQLSEETWGDDAIEDWDVWHEKMSECVDLYYELRAEGVFGDEYE